jgi:hypothetical protein
VKSCRRMAQFGLYIDTPASGRVRRGAREGVGHYPLRVGDWRVIYTLHEDAPCF